MRAFCLLKRKEEWAPVSRYFLTTADLVSGSGWVWSHLPTIQEVNVLVVAWGRGKKKNLGTKTPEGKYRHIQSPSVSSEALSADARHGQHSNAITTKTKVHLLVLQRAPYNLPAPTATPPTPSHHGDRPLQEGNAESLQARRKLTFIDAKVDCRRHSHPSRGTQPGIAHFVSTKCSHTVRAAVCWCDADLTLHVRKLFSVVRPCQSHDCLHRHRETAGKCSCAAWRGRGSA